MEKQPELSKLAFRSLAKYLLLLIVSLSLLSCQEEELHSISSELELIETTSYEFTDLDENAIQANSFLQKNLFNKSQIKRQAKSMDSEAIYDIKIFGMTLQANLATQISNDSIATYTFNLLDKENFLEGELANLVLVEDKLSQGSYSFFVSYNNWEEVSSGAINILEYSYRLLSGDSKPEITKGERVAMSMRDCDAWETFDCLNHLPEVVLTAPTRPYEPIVLMMEPGLFDGGSGSSGFGADPGMGNWTYSGGGSGGKYPTTPTVPEPKTPCENVRELTKIMKLNNNLGKEIKSLYNKRINSIEHGFTYDSKGKIYQGTDGTPTSINLKHSPSTLWAFHTHPEGGNIFSIKDLYFYIDLLRKSEEPLNDVKKVVFTNSEYHYMLSFDGDERLFKDHFNHPDSPIVDKNTFKREDIRDLYYQYNVDYSMETSFFHIVENHILTSPIPLDYYGIRLVRFKMSADGSKILQSEEIRKNVFGTLDRSDC